MPSKYKNLTIASIGFLYFLSATNILKTLPIGCVEEFKNNTNENINVKIGSNNYKIGPKRSKLFPGTSEQLKILHAEINTYDRPTKIIPFSYLPNYIAKEGSIYKLDFGTNSNSSPNPKLKNSSRANASYCWGKYPVTVKYQIGENPVQTKIIKPGRQGLHLKTTGATVYPLKASANPIISGMATEKISKFTKSDLLTLQPLNYNGTAWFDRTVENPDKTTVTFRARTNNDVIVNLANRSDQQKNNHTWQIVIGGWNNTQSAIKKHGKIVCSTTVKQNPSAAVKEGRYELYWVSIYNGFIMVGKGFPGENIIMSWRDPNPPKRVNYIGFSSNNKETKYAEVQMLPPIIPQPPISSYYKFEKPTSKLETPMRLSDLGGIAFQATPKAGNSINISFKQTQNSSPSYQFILNSENVSLNRQGKSIITTATPSNLRHNGRTRKYWGSLNNGFLTLGYGNAGTNPLLIWKDPTVIKGLKHISLKTSGFNASSHGYNITTVNEWQSYKSGYGKVSARKQDNIVYVEGMIKGGKFTGSKPVATLPTGFRPVKRHIFNLNNHDKTCRVDVDTRGNIYWMAGGNRHGWFSLSGIAFSIVDGKTLPLKNNWNAYGRGYGTPTYKKIENVVYVDGLVEGGKFITSKPVATLPLGFRPIKRHIFNLNNNSNTCRVDITPDGNIYWMAGGNSPSYFSLAGIMFSTVDEKILPLKNGWKTYSGDYGNPTYKKVGNIVYVDGMIKNGKFSGSKPIATLPPGFRPVKRQIFNLNNHENTCRVDITSDGNIYWWTGGHDHGWFSLAGIRFSTTEEDLKKSKIKLPQISSFNYDKIEIIPAIYIDFERKKEGYKAKKELFQFDSGLTIRSPFKYQVSQSGRNVTIQDLIYGQLARVGGMTASGKNYPYRISIQKNGLPDAAQMSSPTKTSLELGMETKAKTKELKGEEKKAVANAKQEMANSLIQAGGAIGGMGGNNPWAAGAAAAAGGYMVKKGLDKAKEAQRGKEKAAALQREAATIDFQREQMFNELAFVLTEKFVGHKTGESAISPDAVKNKFNVENALKEIRDKKYSPFILKHFSILIDKYNYIVDRIIHSYVVSDKTTKKEIFKGIGTLVNAIDKYNELKEKPLSDYKNLLTLLINIHDNYYIYDQGNKADESYKLKFYFGLSKIFHPIFEEYNATTLGFNLAPFHGEYVWLKNQFETPEKGSIHFEAQGIAEIVIGLAQKPGKTRNTGKEFYEVAIGKWANTASDISLKIHDKTYTTKEILEKENEHAVATPIDFKKYWVSINNGKIVLGINKFEPKNKIIEWEDPYPIKSIKRVGLSSGNNDITYRGVILGPPLEEWKTMTVAEIAKAGTLSVEKFKPLAIELTNKLADIQKKDIKTWLTNFTSLINNMIGQSKENLKLLKELVEKINIYNDEFSARMLELFGNNKQKLDALIKKASIDMLSMIKSTENELKSVQKETANFWVKKLFHIINNISNDPKELKALEKLTSKINKYLEKLYNWSLKRFGEKNIKILKDEIIPKAEKLTKNLEEQKIESKTPTVKLRKIEREAREDEKIRTGEEEEEEEYEDDEDSEEDDEDGDDDEDDDDYEEDDDDYEEDDDDYEEDDDDYEEDEEDEE